MSKPPVNQVPSHLAVPMPTHESKPMSFKTWVAEVQGVLTFVIEPDEWRKYYDAGLPPVDAIAQHTTDEEV
jgi:hypothetical protein